MQSNKSKYPYKTRIGGSTCTIFVPYDCNNNCPFCINKAEYSDTSNFSLPKIIESIKIINTLTPNCDFVISGGEPFANLDSLQKILNEIDGTHKIFINTTMPAKNSMDEDSIINFIKSNNSKITCINISRHINTYIEESNDDFISSLPIKKRINCVIYDNFDGKKIRKFAIRWAKQQIPIQFRYDYTVTNTDNLYEEKNDEILNILKENFTYIGLNGCRIRNGFHFKFYAKDYDVWETITYHKTLPYSTIVEKDANNGIVYSVLYDILIKQNGDLHSDWDGTPLDLQKYKDVTYEPYDLTFLYKDEAEWLD